MRQPIRRNQTPSDAIRRHQTQSDLHRRTARSSSGAVPGGIAQVDGRWNWTVKRTCGEGRGAVVSTCMLEHLHGGRWNSTVKHTSKPRRNQTQSDAIRRNQTQSDALRRTQTHSDALRRNQTQSDAIRRNQTQSDSHKRTSKPRRTGSFRWYHTAPNWARARGARLCTSRSRWPPASRTCGQGRGAVVSACMLEHSHGGAAVHSNGTRAPARPRREALSRRPCSRRG
jgi:hypothetical protein